MKSPSCRKGISVFKCKKRGQCDQNVVTEAGSDKKVWEGSQEPDRAGLVSSGQVFGLYSKDEGKPMQDVKPAFQVYMCPRVIAR